MHFEIERQSLLLLLGHAQPIVERRNTIPILSNVLLTANDSTLTAEVTDLDIQTHEKVAATIKQPGVTTVSAKLLFDIARKLPDGALIDFEVQSSQAIIRAGRAKFTLPVLPADGFPHLQTDEWDCTFDMDTDELQRLLDKVRFAISTDETRYYLQGVYLHLDSSAANGPEIRAVATDGHRLALQSSHLPAGNASIPNIIIPRKCVTEVSKNLDNCGETIKLLVSKTKVRFILGELTITSKLVDGTYPDYARVIPSGNMSTLVASAKHLADAIDRVSTIATERTRAVKLEVHGDRVEISTQSSDVGLGMETVYGRYDGPALTIGFNAAYLKDMLNQYGERDVEIKLKDPTSPTLIRPVGSTDSLAVCMPLRI